MSEFDIFSRNPDDFKPGAGDEKLFVVFHMDIVHDEAASLENGRPIYRDTEFVRIFVPGDKTNVIDRPVRPSDINRFSKQYLAFKEGKAEEEQIDGTPLRDWPMVGRAQVAELHYFGVRTVEQLADVRDDLCVKIPGLHSLKQTAGVWISKAKSTAEAAKIAKRLQDSDARVTELEKTVHDLIATNEALQDQLRIFLSQSAASAKATA